MLPRRFSYLLLLLLVAASEALPSISNWSNISSAPSFRKLKPHFDDLYHDKPLEELIWEENFDELDPNVWEHMITAWRGGNKEFQYYRDDRRNSYVKDGILHIVPTLTADEYGEEFLYNGNLSYPGCNQRPCDSVSDTDIVLPIQSARIYSKKSFGFHYGRVEVRAKLPRGDWLWPAIWMKPTENHYGWWPASGEIDLVEARGNKKLYNAQGVSYGIDRMGSTLHYGPNSSYNVWRPTNWEMSLEGSGRDFSQDFHLFGMDWTKNSITFTVDDKVIGSVSPPSGGFWHIGNFSENPGGTNIWQNGEYLAPFDRDFFFVLNVAVGGTFFSSAYKNKDYPRPWYLQDKHPLRDFWSKRDLWYPTWDPIESSLRVDYIRVYKPVEPRK
ncbi:beta-1,3-glucan-binding protein-like [Cloeon dipterum]|uniref:beta-1,3-glucan-binding protein-like n=1 Tax=Cloeon dipterum TaxID=197152 RepID=UPI0032207D4F